MSSKLGTIFSLMFVVMVFLFGLDLLCLQFSYSTLDSKGVSIAYYIAKTSRIDEEYLSYLANKYEVEIKVEDGQSTNYGDVVEFVLYDEFDPFIIARENIPLSIRRTTVIGYYG